MNADAPIPVAVPAASRADLDAPAHTPNAPCLGLGGVLLVVLVATAVAGVGTAWWLQQRLDRALALRPPVMLLDLATAARAASPTQLPAVLRAYTQTADRLAAHGVLVLERNTVLAAPPALQIDAAEVSDAPD